MELKGKTILVTGATGFIGWRLAERLAHEEGAKVRALARSKEKGAKLKQEFPNLSIEPVIGDLSDLDSLKLAAKGCEIIFHCAAWASDRGSRPQRGPRPGRHTSNAICLAAESSPCPAGAHEADPDPAADRRLPGGPRGSGAHRSSRAGRRLYRGSDPNLAEEGNRRVRITPLR